MGKLERTLQGNFNTVLKGIEQTLLESSHTASLEEKSDFHSNGARCSVRQFEWFSPAGGNRITMTVTLFQAEEGPIYLSAVTSGGSQAMFYKTSSWGGDNVLNILSDYLN